MTTDEITAIILTLISAPMLAAWTVNNFATWNRARRAERKSTR